MPISVLLISIDGLRADGLRQAETPHIDRLIANGAHTTAARSVMPSVTLPCHTSMFRGVHPERHGITTNTWAPQVRPVPSILDVAHAGGRSTAAFYNWEPLRDLADPGSLDESLYLNNCSELDGDIVLARLAGEHLGQRQSDFTFVYLGHTDVAGHDHGWMSAAYLAAIGRADEAVGLLGLGLGSGMEQTVCILTSDHGGHDQTHGTEREEDMVIPWVACGPGVPSGRIIEEEVSIIDNAPTVAALLGVEPARDWVGNVIDQVVV